MQVDFSEREVLAAPTLVGDAFAEVIAPVGVKPGFRRVIFSVFTRSSFPSDKMSLSI